MSVRVHLDKPYSYFTNLDVITGRVILSLSREEAIATIVVKLEGESKTRLAGNRAGRRPSGLLSISNRDNGDNVTELEVHKVLYKTDLVFPSGALPQAAAYTVSAGQHEYPFEFKIPFNNSCSNTDVTTVSFLELSRESYNHVKKTLPPSLTGFPGEAEIRYFVKATVQRPAFFKENYRTAVDFKFLPIEPPRPPPNRRESYARRTYQFQQSLPPPPPPKSRPFSRTSTEIPRSGSPPNVSIDGRLPDPATITCNLPVPLRVLIKILNDSTDMIFLHILHVELVSYTSVRAQELQRTEKGGWILFSKQNLNMQLKETNAETKEMEVNSKLWSETPLPPTVPPTFETCNISRHYHLELRIGLTYGRPRSGQSELTLQQLVMPVNVYSGIKPPEALLNEMARRNPRPVSLQSQSSLRPSAGVQPPAATTPLVQNSVQPHAQLVPVQPVLAQPTLPNRHSAQPTPSPVLITAPSSSRPTSIRPIYPDAPPPSYEDAIAEDMAPVDGPRREYDQPPQAWPSRSEKGGGRNRPLSERLFP
ncbi:hypothetical protein MMC25_003107 [Agyrium rufum]|nr:hypothetical protein [Agyrium rufum]